MSWLNLGTTRKSNLLTAPETFVAGVDFLTRQPVTPCDQRHRNLVTLDAPNREMLNFPSSPGWVGDYFLNQKDEVLTTVQAEFCGHRQC